MPLRKPVQTCRLLTLLAGLDQSLGQPLLGCKVSPQRGHMRIDGLTAAFQRPRELAGLQ
jgi:hypothetical protein